MEKVPAAQLMQTSDEEASGSQRRRVKNAAQKHRLQAAVLTGFRRVRPRRAAQALCRLCRILVEPGLAGLACALAGGSLELAGAAADALGPLCRAGGGLETAGGAALPARSLLALLEECNPDASKNQSCALTMQSVCPRDGW